VNAAPPRDAAAAAAPDPRTRLGRNLFFAGLYFAEGAPIGFVWWALPVWLRSADVSPGEIARLMAWVAWPWALKLVWAPLVDLVEGPRFGLRSWILAAQTCMALSLLPLLLLDIGSAGDLLLAVLLLHGFAAATQDAAIDTLAVRSVPARERGAVSGWMQLGMLAARAVFGGGAVLLAGRIGERGVVLLLVAAILGPSLLLRSAGPGRARTPLPPVRERLARYREALGRARRQRSFWIGLLFASVAGAGYEGSSSLAGPLLLDRGASAGIVGAFFLVPVVVLMAAGALLGGLASDRFGRRRVILLGEALAAASVIAVGALVWGEPAPGGVGPLLALLALLNLSSGIATAALYGLFMELVDPVLPALQFCAFMGAINLCYVWATRCLGLLIDGFGYGPGLVAMGLVSLAALPLLLAMRQPRPGPGGLAA